MQKRFDRRSLLRLMAAAPFGLAVACSASQASDLEQPNPEKPAPLTEEPAAPAPTAEPPFVLPAGEDRRLLMAGTRYETPMYVFGSGRPGRIALALGGVHGNEPGGWLAADWIVDHRRPENGALLVVPRANKVAISLSERTTDALADLNRSYPGFTDGKPMEQMALEIVNVIRDFHVGVVHDMHESWAFYKDRTTNGTAFIGETIATSGDEGTALVRSVIERVNSTVRYDHEAFSFRDFNQPLGTDNPNLPRQTNVPPSGRGTSSLGLNRFFPGLVPVLVEMGQQQALERRIALHIQVLDEVLRQTGVGVA
jgi:hypothetical protein